MLGPPKPRRLGEPIAVSLEELVPPRNFYRHLEAKLDLGFVRDLVRTTYSAQPIRNVVARQSIRGSSSSFRS